MSSLFIVDIFTGQYNFLKLFFAVYDFMTWELQQELAPIYIQKLTALRNK